MGDLMEEGEVRDMTPRLVGEVYKRRTSGESTALRLYALYECQYCKNTFETMVQSVKSGATKSCGCNLFITHGLSSNRFYGTWYAMLHRCDNLESINYKYYGARGIIVCEEWLDVRNFVAWAEATYPNIEDATLDRIDNDKGYSPDNCRWVDKYTQVINQRVKKNNTSGYVGINWSEARLKWVSRISVEKKRIWLGDYKTIEEAVQARDNYIVENKLPHKLSTDYKGDK